MAIDRNKDYMYRKGDWVEVLEAARETAGKEALEKEPSNDWKQKMVIAEHSPIRCLVYRWRWNRIKYWITNHLVRHMWEPFIKSQRPDRNGMTDDERDALPQGANVQMIGEANAQHLIDTSRKRLCYNAHPETRKRWEWVKREVYKIDKEVAFAMVPNCVYRAGCPEMKTCGHWLQFLGSQRVTDMNMFNIAERYEAYNKWRGFDD